ncbi:hypothetical protein E2C01_091267 [Portunus trituberculatus]|uniref:Uncharacterized protein n=1 Tax=Portunus trituberculatus TaxID=210409 RepID=A0A5B7JDI9_PORTR|nr:hypothetical protein [Portunus trituberculatus]
MDEEPSQHQGPPHVSTKASPPMLLVITPMPLRAASRHFLFTSKSLNKMLKKAVVSDCEAESQMRLSD